MLSKELYYSTFVHVDCGIREDGTKVKWTAFTPLLWAIFRYQIMLYLAPGNELYQKRRFYHRNKIFIGNPPRFAG